MEKFFEDEYKEREKEAEEEGQVVALPEAPPKEDGLYTFYSLSFPSIVWF
jgi:hypothetical protein